MVRTGQDAKGDCGAGKGWSGCGADHGHAAGWSGDPGTTACPAPDEGRLAIPGGIPHMAGHCRRRGGTGRAPSLGEPGTRAPPPWHLLRPRAHQPCVTDRQYFAAHRPAGLDSPAPAPPPRPPRRHPHPCRRLHTQHPDARPGTSAHRTPPAPRSGMQRMRSSRIPHRPQRVPWPEGTSADTPARLRLSRQLPATNEKGDPDRVTRR